MRERGEGELWQDRQREKKSKKRGRDRKNLVKTRVITAWQTRAAAVDSADAVTLRYVSACIFTCTHACSQLASALTNTQACTCCCIMGFLCGHAATCGACIGTCKHASVTQACTTRTKKCRCTDRGGYKATHAHENWTTHSCVRYLRVSVVLNILIRHKGM